ncbi:MAG: hypothetical protein WDO24_14555 [Pseudomonadota bacterium]
MIDAGNIVHATDTTGLVVVTQIEPISVLFTLPSDYFGLVNRQMTTGQLTVAASSRVDDTVLGQGTLLLINNQIDQTTGTIQLRRPSRTRIMRSGPGCSSTPSCWSRPAMARSRCPPPPCSAVRKGSSPSSSSPTTRSRCGPSRSRRPIPAARRR